MLRVAEGPQESRQEVIAYGEGYGEELHEEESVGIAVDVGRGIDEDKDPVAEHAADNGDDDSKDDAYAQGVGHIRPHLREVLGTESLGHRDGETGTGAVAEAHDEKHYRRRGTDGGQRADTYPPAYDGGIDDEIHLLKDVPKDEGKSKPQDATGGRTYGHIVNGGHRRVPSFRQQHRLETDSCRQSAASSYGG